MILRLDTGASGREDDDVAAPGFAEVVAHAINEQMIAGLSFQTHDLFAFVIRVFKLQAGARLEFLLPKSGGNQNGVRTPRDRHGLPEVHELDTTGISDRSSVPSTLALMSR